MIKIQYTYQFDCDWPAGPRPSGRAVRSCRDHLIVRGSETLADATARARREGWTVSRSRDGLRFVRCPSHAYAQPSAVAS